MENKEIKVNKMGVMPVRKLLYSMAWPAILSMTVNSLYNVVDSIFVAQISEDALTAVSIVSPVQLFISAVAVGTGVGVNSLIARRLGAKKQDEADKAASTGLRMSLCNYLLFLIIGLFLAKPFVGAYAQQGTYIFEAGCTYLSVVCIGSLFLNVQSVTERMLQSTGNMKGPMFCSISGALINIVLDPVLIFGWFGLPAMGVAGAAAATVISQCAGMCLGLYILLRKQSLVHIQFRNFSFDKEVVKDIYKVGFPSIVIQTMGPLVTICYNGILVGFSTTAVAVYGAYSKIQNFVFMPLLGLNMGSIPIIGYNYGAKDKKRLTDTYKETMLVAAVVAVAGMMLFQLCPGFLLELFDASPEMMEIGVPALRIISWSFIPSALFIITVAVFQATGHGIYSLLISVLKQLAGTLPLAFILLKIGGVGLSWAAFPLSELIGVAACIILLKRLYNNKISKF